MYDAIVVGARCAGSPTAMLLARKGYRVLLLDRAGFPSDTLSTHYIHQPGIAALQRWGLLGALLATGCPPIREQVFDVGPFALVGAPPPADGVADAYAPRRYVLDEILVRAAVAAGAELREHFTVDEVVRDGSAVTGIRGRERGGATVTENARMVIGADGRNSFVARTVGAEAYNIKAKQTCAYYSYWDGVDAPTAELHPRPNRMVIAAPTSDRRTIVIVYWPLAEFPAVRSDVEGSFLAAMNLIPELAERVRAGERADRIYGSGDLPFFFRRPYGDGWALVGDAAYHKDPITAQGITDAFRDAQLLAGAIDGGLSGTEPLAHALAEYERRRNEHVLPIYELTHELAGLAPPPPEMQQLFGALRENREQTDRFFGAISGTVPVPEFFAPENLARIVGASAPASVA